MGVESRFKKEKTVAEEYYKSIESVACPLFIENVIFNSDGFHHLRFSAKKERTKKEQMLKMGLLKAAPGIIRLSGTIQEYRKTYEKVGRKKTRGEQDMKVVEYWGLIHILNNGQKDAIRIKVILEELELEMSLFGVLCQPKSLIKKIHIYIYQAIILKKNNIKTPVKGVFISAWLRLRI